MRDDFVELVQRELRDVRWPEPAEIRARGRRRTRRTAVVGAAVAVLAVGSVSALVVGRSVAPAPSVAASAGGRAEIPVEAMLAPSDVPVGSDERLGNAGLGERVRVDDLLRGCGQERGVTLESESRYSRSQSLMVTDAPEGFAPYPRPILSQDVYRLAAGAADRFFAGLDRLVAACTSWRGVSPVQLKQGPGSVTVEHRWTVVARDFAGDQAILLQHTMVAPVDTATGQPLKFTLGPEYRLVVRVGDLVTVLVPGEPLRPGVPGATVTEATLRDLGRVAADRMCVAANPGC